MDFSGESNAYRRGNLMTALGIIGISLLLTVIFSLLIIRGKKNMEYLITVRSPTLLHFTNISGFCCIVILSIYLMVDDFTTKTMNYLNGLFMVFQFVFFLTIFLKYLRLHICSKFSKNVQENDLQAYKYFPQNKFYYEYMYTRITLFVGFIFLLIILIISATEKVEIPTIVDVFIDESYADPKHTTTPKNLFWIITLAIENTAIFIIGMVIFTCDFKAKIKLELFLHFAIMGVILIPHGIRLHLILYLFSCLTFMILQILHALVPFLESLIGIDTNLYGMTENLTDDLYLFLSNEQCYDSFLKFLKTHNVEEKTEEKLTHLNFYTEVIKYRMNFLINPSEREIMKNLQHIYSTYFETENYINIFIREQYMRVQAKGKNLIKKGEVKIEVFDEALENSTLYLNKEFETYKGTSLYVTLLNEIRYQGFIRSKFLHCGLIQK